MPAALRKKRKPASGGWGGSIVIVDADRRLCFAYMMNRMAPGIIGGPNAAALTKALYDIVGR